MMLLNKAQGLINAIIAKIDGISKPRQKFIQHLLILYMGLRGKYNFINMARYGSFNEKTYRNQMEKPFDWAGFNVELVRSNCSKELILAYDPSYLPKSGKKTPEVGNFYSGTAQRVKRGIEIGCMAIIDVENGTGFSLEAVQTPVTLKGQDREESSVTHHLKVVLNRATEVESLGINVGVFDGYFAKANFVNGITDNSNLEVISKFRPDANLRYLYNGPKQEGRGRPKLYEGKVNTRFIDRRRIRFCFAIDEDTHVFSGPAYSISLKRIVRIVYIEHYGADEYANGHAILFSTDLTLDPQKIYLYYKQRFQIEFLFRDAKNFAGLEHCQARSAQKINFHVNASLSTVSLAKAIHYLPIPKEERESFSMLDIKTLYFNQYITDLIFSKLALDLSCEKIRKLYDECLSIGRLAA
jgi:hypothetical protein